MESGAHETHFQTPMHDQSLKASSIGALTCDSRGLRPDATRPGRQGLPWMGSK